MKGPGLRLDLDVRRIWECPSCGRRDRFEGDVVSARCPCRDQPMRLVEGRRQVRKFAVPVSMPEPVDPIPPTAPETPPEAEEVVAAQEETQEEIAVTQVVLTEVTVALSPPPGEDVTSP